MQVIQPKILRLILIGSVLVLIEALIIWKFSLVPPVHNFPALKDIELFGWKEVSPGEWDRKYVDTFFEEGGPSANSIKHTVLKAAYAYGAHHSYLYLISISPADYTRFREAIIRKRAQESTIGGGILTASPDTIPKWFTPPHGETLDWNGLQGYYDIAYDPNKELLYLYNGSF